MGQSVGVTGSALRPIWSIGSAPFSRPFRNMRNGASAMVEAAVESWLEKIHNKGTIITDCARFYKSALARG
eukprot:1006834-Pyramimonas_sp.AAC.1